MKRTNRFMQSFLLLCAACFTLIVGCIHEDLSAYASVDSKIVSVDAQANNVSYTITANTDWTISSNEDWCTPTPDSGTGTKSINIIIASNPSSEERTANLTLTCGGKDTSVEVIQAGLVETLEVSPTQYTVDNSSQNANIAVMANTSWTVTSSTDGTEDNWLKLNTTSGSNNGFINVAIEENTTYEERSAVITVFSKRDGETSLVRTVTITQLSQGSPSLILSQTSLVVSSLDQTKYVTYVSNIADVVASSDFAWCTASVEDGSIKIDIAKNTAVSSRTATVTVIGVVEGETVVTQILVSQSGVGAPEIALVNDYMSFGYTGGEASFSWVAYSGVSVLLGNTSSWITATKDGSAVKAVVGVNNAEDSRVGYIELIATNSSGEQTFYYITIYQSGVGAPSITAVPSSISLGSSAGTGSVYVVVDNYAASLTGYTTSNSWINVTGVTSSDSKEYLVNYTYDANTSDASRNAMITLEFKIGSQSYLFSISVVQAGLGTPAISTLENIFLQADQTEHTQSIWFMDGDKTNVDYEVFAISYSTSASGSTGSVEAQEWITDAVVIEEDGNYYLSVTTLKNTESEVRYGEITLIATRDDSSTIIKISVTQGAHAGAGIAGLEQEVFVDWEAQQYTYWFSALNNSTVTVMSQPSWITSAEIFEDGDYASDNASGDAEGSYDKRLVFYVSEYNGGETGSFREGIITLKADNGNSNVVYYDVKICQYEPSAALAAITDEIYLTYDAQNGLVTPVDLMNNAKIVKVYSSASWLAIDKGYSYINGEGTTVNVADGTFCDWTSSTTSLAYTSGEESFFYNVEKFDGGTDESRTAYIYITVQNNNANTMTYTITVTQGDPMEALADVPEKIYVGYSSNTYTFEINDKSGVSEYKAEFVSNEKAYTTDADWLRYISPDEFTAVTSGEAAEVSFNVGQYDGEEGETRTGVLAVTVSGEHANDQTYYVEIIQGEATENTLTVPEYMEYTYLATSDVFKVESTGANNSFTMQWDDNWLSMVNSDDNNSAISQYGGKVTPTDGISKLCLTVTEYTNSTESYREQVVTYTATGDNYRPVVAYTTIRQLAQGEAGITGATTIYLDYNEAVGDDGDSRTLTFSLLNGATISDVTVSNDSDWLTADVVDGSDDTVEYSVSQYDGSAGEYRTGTFVVTVSNNNVNESTIEVTVIQGSPADAVATVPTEIHVGYLAGNKDFNIDLDESVTTVSAVNLDTADTWLTDVSATKVSGEDSAEIDFSYTQYSGYDGDSRTATIMVTVSGDNYNDQVYYVNVIQNSPEAAEVSVDPYLEFTYLGTYEDDTAASATIKELEVTVSGSGAVGATLEYDLDDMDGDWFNITSTVETAAIKVVKYTVDKYTSSTEPSRSATLQLTTKADNYRPVVSFVDITQTSQGAAGISGATTVYLDYNEAVTADSQKTLNFSLANGSEIKSVDVTSGDSWLTAVSSSDNLSVYYYVNSAYTGTSGQYRTGTFDVTVGNNNSDTSTIQVTVIQGSPNEASATVPSTLYVGYSEYTTGDTVTDSDVKSVTIDLDYGVTAISAVSQNSWITVESTSPLSIDDTTNTATLSFSCSDYDGASTSRTGYIMVTVSSDNVNDQVYYIEVVQGSPTEASISAVSTYEHTYAETTGSDGKAYYYELSYTYSGDGIETVTAEVSKQFTKFIDSNGETSYDDYINYVSPWFYFYDGTQNQNMTTTVDAGDNFYYGLTEYDGASGDYRVTTLTLTAQGDNYRPAVTYVDIVQYAQADADVEVSDVYVDAAAQNDGVDTSGKVKSLTYTPNLLNGSTISSATSNNDWIVVPADSVETKSFKYYITENTTGKDRTGTISLTVENANSDKTLATIMVNQSAASVTTATMPSLIYANNTDATGSFTIYPSSNASAVTAEVLGGVTWLTVTSVTTKAIESATVNYKADDYEGQTSRKATIAVTIKSDDAATNDQVYYVYVEQAATEDVIFYAPDSKSYGVDGTVGIGTVSGQDNIDYIDYTISGVDGANTEVTATSDSTWIKLKTATSGDKEEGTSYSNGKVYYKVFENDSMARTGIITLTAKVDGYRSVVRYLTITQDAMGDYTFTISNSEKAYDSSGTVGINAVAANANMDYITYNFDGTGDYSDHDVYFSEDADWIIMKQANGGNKDADTSYNGGYIYYKVEENKTSSARSTTITLKAEIEDYGTQTKYLTINQSAASDLELFHTGEIYASAAGVTTAETYTVSAQSGATISTIEATESLSWVEITETTSGFTYTITSNTGSERVGYITLKVTDSNGSVVYDTVKVTQFAPATMSVLYLPSISATAAEVSSAVTFKFTTDSTLSSLTVTASTDDTSNDWITIASYSTTDKQFTYTLSANTAYTSRTGYIYYSMTGTDGTTATGVIEVNQAGASEPYPALTSPVSGTNIVVGSTTVSSATTLAALTFNSDATYYKASIVSSSTGDTTWLTLSGDSASISDSAATLQYTALSALTSGSRTATIKITAGSDEDYTYSNDYYIFVSQSVYSIELSGQSAYSISAKALITSGTSPSYTGSYYTVAYDCMFSGASYTESGATLNWTISDEWLKVATVVSGTSFTDSASTTSTSNTSGNLYFTTVAENTADYARVGTITLTLKDASNNTLATKVITVTQEATAN